MHTSPIMTAHDSIYHQQAEIKDLIQNFFQRRLTLQRFHLKLLAVKNTLSTLNPETFQLMHVIHSLENKISTKLVSLNAYTEELNKTLDLIAIQDQKIYDTHNKKQQLMKERERLIHAWLHYQDVLQKKAELYLAKTASKQSNSIGAGVDIIEFESLPKIDTQAQSIEQRILKKAAKIDFLQTEIHSLHNRSLEKVDAIHNGLQRVNSALVRIDQQIEDLSVKIEELYSLKMVADSGSLHSAAVKGDLDDVRRRLLQMASPNAKDDSNHKPLYYACRAGHVQAALLLLDVTTLTDSELHEIIDHLPRFNKDIYDTLFAALQASRALYDHLWDVKRSYGDNIIRIFKDYYSPELLNNLPLIADQAKRVLSLMWDRIYIQMAEDIVTIFSKLEPKLKQDRYLCQALINGKWDAFFESHPETTDVLARRLHYVKTKLEPRQVNALERTLDFELHQVVQAPVKNPLEKPATNNLYAFFKSPIGFLMGDKQQTTREALSQTEDGGQNTQSGPSMGVH